MEYYLSKLNAREFESLGSDIISKDLCLRVEKFKAGKDGGIDGRFWIGKEEGVLQCKHYNKTGYKGLISKLKKEEAEKVRRIKPARYIFFTSIPLSRKNKSEIFKIFQPYINSESDIWGEDEINTFLSAKENQDIVERNYKLWITSTLVFDILLHNAINGRSESTLKEIESDNERYVITQYHLKGIEILKKNNVVIITGNPGIGKTTLANNLALYYIANGFKFCDIEESISEAEDLFREKEQKKIIFYCDDFLGSNMYDAISNKRDSHIVKFINRIKRDKTKRFILTSRTNILSKAVSLSHQFQNNNIRKDELLLNIEELSEVDKANILYNHIYHSRLSKTYIDELYRKKRYRKIINHRNYNPRIIDFITDFERVQNIPLERYWSYIEDKLENPEEIWGEYFQTQIDGSIRVLSFLTAFNGGVISEVELGRSYSYYKTKSQIIVDHTDCSFSAVRKLAVKTILNREQNWDDNFEYTLFNPSIADFILNSYIEDVHLVVSVLEALGTISSIDFIISLELNKRINRDTVNQIQQELFDSLLNTKLNNKEWDYLILLSYLNTNNENCSVPISKVIKTISQDDESTGNRLYELLSIIVDTDKRHQFDSFDFISRFIEEKTMNADEINKLAKFIDLYEIKDEYFIEITSSSVDTYLRQELEGNKDSVEIANHIRYSYFFEQQEMDVDYEGIESELESALDSIISDLEEEIWEYVSIDHSSILSDIDFEQEIESYKNSYGDYYEDEFRGSSSFVKSGDDIDAIFERD